MIRFRVTCASSSYPTRRVRLKRGRCDQLGVAKAVADANPFAHTGYKLASRFLRIDRPLIESLARELTCQGTIEGDALRKWLDANASALNFDKLETSTTY